MTALPLGEIPGLGAARGPARPGNKGPRRQGPLPADEAPPPPQRGRESCFPPPPPPPPWGGGGGGPRGGGGGYTMWEILPPRRCGDPAGFHLLPQRRLQPRQSRLVARLAARDQHVLGVG